MLRRSQTISAPLLHRYSVRSEVLIVMIAPGARLTVFDVGTIGTSRTDSRATKLASLALGGVGRLRSLAHPSTVVMSNS